MSHPSYDRTTVERVIEEVTREVLLRLNQSAKTAEPGGCNCTDGSCVQNCAGRVDRVVQAAVKLIIEPIFEADFEDCSHGFRPGRSAHDAIKSVEQSIREGRNAIYDADLASYFDTIPHDKVIAGVRQRIVDGQGSSLPGNQRCDARSLLGLHDHPRHEAGDLLVVNDHHGRVVSHALLDDAAHGEGLDSRLFRLWRAAGGEKKGDEEGREERVKFHRRRDDLRRPYGAFLRIDTRFPDCAGIM